MLFQCKIIFFLLKSALLASRGSFLDIRVGAILHNGSLSCRTTRRHDALQPLFHYQPPARRC